MGLVDIKSAIEKRMIRYWAKVHNGSVSKFSNIVYRFARKLHEDGNHPFHSDWIDQIKTSLERAGMSNIWNMTSDLTTHAYIPPDLLTNNLKMHSETLWVEKLQNDEKCQLYRSFKFRIQQEKYLCLSMPHTKAIAQLRSGNCSEFPSNKFKYSQDQSISCKRCNSSDFPNEIHYVFNCSHFNAIRPNFCRPDQPIADLSPLIPVYQDKSKLATLAGFITRIQRDLKD